MIKRIINKCKNFIVKYYKILTAILIIIIIGVIIVITQKVKPVLKQVELGDHTFDLTKVSNYVKTNMNTNECDIETDIDVDKIGKYTYSLICPKKTYGPYKVKVKDTIPPKTIIRKVSILPGNGIKEEDFFWYVYDLSNYHLKFTSYIEDKYDIGSYGLRMNISDDEGNSKEMEVILDVTENAPVETLKCDSVPIPGLAGSEYYVYLNKDNEIYDVLRITRLKFEDNELYLEKKREYYQKGLIDGIDGDAEFHDDETSVIMYKYILDVDYKNEFNIKYQPKNKDDVYKTFNNKCEKVEKDKE